MNIRYRNSDNDEGLIYTKLAETPDSDVNTTPEIHTIDLEQSSHLVRHSFPPGPTWTPKRMEINGRKGRRAICVLAQDGLHYRIYDLDSMTNDEETMEIVDE